MALVAGLGLDGRRLVQPERVSALEHEHLVEVLLVRQEIVQLQSVAGIASSSYHGQSVHAKDGA